MRMALIRSAADAARGLSQGGPTLDALTVLPGVLFMTLRDRPTTMNTRANSPIKTSMRLLVRKNVGIIP